MAVLRVGQKVSVNLVGLHVAEVEFGGSTSANGIVEDIDPATKEITVRLNISFSGRQFLMINNIDMNENPPAVEGAAPNASADELMASYMEHMIPELLSRACHPVIMGNAAYIAMDVVGIEGAQEWTGAALFRYRSRRSFMEIVSNPAFRGKHHFKTAALDKTIAFPIETTLYPADARLLLGLILLALTALVDALVLSRRQS